MRNDKDERWQRQTIYVSRKEGGKGPTSIENTVEESIRRLEDYIKKRKKDKLRYPVIPMVTWVQRENQQKEREEKNNMDISSDKLIKSLTRRSGHG